MCEGQQNEELQNQTLQTEETPLEEITSTETQIEMQTETQSEMQTAAEESWNVEETSFIEEEPMEQEASVAAEEQTEEEQQAEEEQTEEQLDQKEEKVENMSGNKSSKSNFWFYGILIAMILAVFCFRVYWNNTFGGVVVDGASMNKTLQTGDKLLMRYCKDADDLQRGDVIVVKVEGYEEFSGSTTKYLIKRLIAIEGDKVRCTDGQIEICYAGTTEYQLLEEPYAYYTNPKLYDFSEYVVGEDEIFFLGDNRNNSCDSRYKEVGGSHLEKLYKESDVYGVVSDWAIENRSWLSKVFFWNAD